MDGWTSASITALHLIQFLGVSTGNGEERRGDAVAVCCNDERLKRFIHICEREAVVLWCHVANAQCPMPTHTQSATVTTTHHHHQQPPTTTTNKL